MSERLWIQTVRATIHMYRAAEMAACMLSSSCNKLYMHSHHSRSVAQQQDSPI